MWPETFPPHAFFIHMCLALEALMLAILLVMLAIGYVLGRLKDKEDQIGVFVNTFWRELLWPPLVMPIDAATARGRSGPPLGPASRASDGDEFYGRMPKSADGSVDKVDLEILVVPHAASDAVVGRDSGGLRIQVTGEHGDGKSNKSLIELVAGAMGVKPYQVTLTKGHYQPRKTVQIQGISRDDLDSKLDDLPDAE